MRIMIVLLVELSDEAANHFGHLEVVDDLVDVKLGHSFFAWIQLDVRVNDLLQKHLLDRFLAHPRMVTNLHSHTHHTIEP